MCSPELLSRLRAGDQQALAGVYRELYAPLWRLTFVLVRDGAVAEEIIQDVFLALWRRRETVEADDDIRAYLYASVRNRAMDHLRHARVVHDTAGAITHGTLDAPVMGRAGPTPHEHTEAEEFHAAYRAALGALSERDRVALLLRWEEEMTLEQVARVLDLSIEGARKAVQRAQRNVQTFLAAYRG